MDKHLEVGDNELVTVLLADDDPAIRDLLQQYLSRKGYIVTAVEDGRAALEKFSQFHFDLCVLDISMPYMNGIELVDMIHEIKHDCGVIFITGAATEEEVQEIYEDNKGTAVLRKPFRCQSVGNYLDMMALRIRRNRQEKILDIAYEEHWKKLPAFQRMIRRIKRALRWMHETLILYLLIISLAIALLLVQFWAGISWMEERTNGSVHQMYNDIRELLQDWKVKDLKKDRP